MIALQTLKYFIWDYCLTNLFEGFNKNFKVYDGNIIYHVNVEKGMRFSSIKLKTQPRIFINCEIINVNRNTNWSSIITFKWSAIRGEPPSSFKYANPYSLGAQYIDDIEFIK